MPSSRPAHWSTSEQALSRRSRRCMARRGAFAKISEFDYAHFPPLRRARRAPFAATTGVPSVPHGSVWTRSRARKPRAVPADPNKGLVITQGHGVNGEHPAAGVYNERKNGAMRRLAVPPPAHRRLGPFIGSRGGRRDVPSRGGRRESEMFRDAHNPHSSKCKCQNITIVFKRRYTILTRIFRYIRATH